MCPFSQEVLSWPQGTPPAQINLLEDTLDDPDASFLHGLIVEEEEDEIDAEDKEDHESAWETVLDSTEGIPD